MNFKKALCESRAFFIDILTVQCFNIGTMFANRNRNGSVKIWALIVSVLLHIAVLGGFLFVGFSKVPDDKPEKVQQVWVNRPDDFSNTPIIPKPAVISSAINADHARLPIQLPEHKALEIETEPVADISELADSREMPFSFDNYEPVSADFFGSTSQRTQLCFVVDCSGSMQGTFSMVRGQLAKSINALEGDVFFYVIFFGDGSYEEIGNGKFLRASLKNKEKTHHFIKNARPRGSTNVISAIKRAMKICSADSQRCTIFFLTDGFELENTESTTVIRSITNLRKQLAPNAKINTIGFAIAAEDEVLLSQIARKNGGNFTKIKSIVD